jgi:hypothetical protein
MLFGIGAVVYLGYGFLEGGFAVFRRARVARLANGKELLVEDVEDLLDEVE